MTKRAWIYCRLDKPCTHTQEMERQKSSLLDYAKEKGYEITGLTEEYGPGIDCGREGLNEVLKHAENGEFDVLLVIDKDRVSRSLSEIYKYCMALKNCGVTVLCMRDPYYFINVVPILDELARGSFNVPDKPDCELIGQDGNVFNLIGIAQKTLRENRMDEEAEELFARINSEAGNYGQALCIIGEYVNITGPKENMDNGEFEQTL